MLEEISIKGFKSIESLVLPMQPITALVGHHGVGKSNFLECLQLLHQVGQGNCQSYVNHIIKGADNLYSWFGLVPHTIELGCQFRKNFYGLTLGPSEPHSIVFKKEEAGFTKDNDQYVTAFEGNNHLETKLKDEQSYSVSAYVMRALDSFRVYHFSDALAPQKTASKCDVEDYKILRGDASNLAAVLKRMKDQTPNQYKRVLDTFRVFQPDLIDFYLEPDENYERLIECQWVYMGNNQVYKLSQLGIGERRLLCLLVLFLQPTPPPIILMEEPDIGLSPMALNLVGALMRTASEHHQIVFTTMSATFLNQFPADAIVYVDKVKGRSHYTRLNRETFENLQKHYTTGYLWEKNGLPLGVPQLS